MISPLGNCNSSFFNEQFDLYISLHGHMVALLYSFPTKGKGYKSVAGCHYKASRKRDARELNSFKSGGPWLLLSPFLMQERYIDWVTFIAYHIIILRSDYTMKKVE